MPLAYGCLHLKCIKILNNVKNFLAAVLATIRTFFQVNIDGVSMKLMEKIRLLCREWEGINARLQYFNICIFIYVYIYIYSYMQTYI